MRPDLLERLAKRVADRAEKGLARRLQTIAASDGPYVRVEGRTLLSFASNNYLGIAAHPSVKEALRDGAAAWGVGAKAAHLLGGHTAAHREAERALAEWTGYPRALLFSTGYMANLGVLGALLGPGDSCVQDKLNHASLLDAARLCGCEMRRYRHADAASAERQLESTAGAGALLVTDGVFSMDGDVAPLRALAETCRRRGTTMMVDDAHGLGVLGDAGAGSVAAEELTPTDVPIYMGTLGKALGCFGAFVAGSEALIEGLIQFSRSYVYTTALPPALASAIWAAAQVAKFEEWRRYRLRRAIARFRQGAAARGLKLLPSTTPIQPVMLGANQCATLLSERLVQRGFYVPAIRPPTVPEGQSRLRVSLTALHQDSDIENLLEALMAAEAGIIASC